MSSQEINEIKQEIARLMEQINVHYQQEEKWHMQVLEKQNFDEQWKKDTSETLNEMKIKYEPMFEVFTSAKGFDKISVWILKGLATIGGGILVITKFLKWLKSSEY